MATIDDASSDKAARDPSAPPVIAAPLAPSAQPPLQAGTSPNQLPGPLRLVFRVGFAGTQLPPEDRGPLLAALRTVFQTIAGRLDEIAPGTPTPCEDPEPLVRHFYSQENPLLRLVTGLCEGADSLAAEALGNNFKPLPQVDGELAAVIPFAFTTYRKSRPEWFLKTFDEQAAKCAYILELDGIFEKPDPDTELAKTRRSRGYRGQSMVLLRQADLIVAVADSKKTGGAGGTMETVRAALKFELPVVFVDAANAAISLIEPDEDFISVLGNLTRNQGSWVPRLRDWVTRIVADPNAVMPGKKHVPHEREVGYENHLLTEYFKNGNVPPFDPVDKQGRPKRWQNLGARLWNGFRNWFRSDFLDTNPTKKNSAKDELLAPYTLWRERSRKLNQHYSDQYRGTFFLNYILATAAVCLAALSLTLLTYYWHLRADLGNEPRHADSASTAPPLHQSSQPAPSPKPASVETPSLGTANLPAATQKSRVPPAIFNPDATAQAVSPSFAIKPPTTEHPAGNGTDHPTHGLPWIFDSLFFGSLLFLGLFKLFFVLRILRNSHAAQRGDWNDRAVDYRYVAERLRTMFYLPLIGSFQPPVAAPPQYDSRVVRQSASDWLLDAVVRHVSPAMMPGIEHCRFDFRQAQPPGGDYQVTLLTLKPAKMLAKVRDNWIELQRAYHDNTARSLSRMSDWIDAWIKLLNSAIIVLVGADAIVLAAEILRLRVAHSLNWMAPLLIFLTAGLPAAVAGLLGIRSQSECQRLSERSAVMRNILAGRPAATPTLSTPKVFREQVQYWLASFANGARVRLPFLARPKPAPAVDPIGSRLETVEKLISQIEYSQSGPGHDLDPGAWVAESLRVTESLADVFVREVVEWSVLYAKEVPEP